jgi:hypothetical protein
MAVLAFMTLPQTQIQAWIERVPVHIQEIIALKGGNKYKEGRNTFKRSWKGLRIKGKLSHHTYLGRNRDNEAINSLNKDPGEWEDVSEEDGIGFTHA